MQTGNDLFYTRLPVNEIPLGELFLEEHLFYKVPANWFVVITDIRDSTEASKQGRHETVNLIATGSIVAVLNLAHKANLTLPYFFGGDGASFIVPPALLTPVIHALKQHQQQTKKNFQLDIRVGYVSVNEVMEQGEELSLGKFRTTRLFTIPIVLGNGLGYAEKKIKSPAYVLDIDITESHELDLEGMQCRWDLVKPPLGNEEVVSLIVVANDRLKQAAAFKKVVDLLDRIYGEAPHRQPISASMLKLKASIARISLEMRARMGKMDMLYAFRTWLTSSLGFFYFKTKYGRQYLDKLIAMSDTLVVDGRINTVISGNKIQREQFISALDVLEDSDEIRYGFSISQESVISCYVRNLNDRHVHFVDGAEGGYNRASSMLKKKLASKVSSNNLTNLH